MSASDGATPPPGSRRRRIQRAIWRGEPAPAGLEQVALQVAIRQAGMRWLVGLYALGLFVEIALLFTEPSAGRRVRDGVLAAVFLAGCLYQRALTARSAAAARRWSPATDR